MLAVAADAVALRRELDMGARVALVVVVLAHLMIQALLLQGRLIQVAAGAAAQTTQQPQQQEDQA